jgi:hypothetical protein
METDINRDLEHDDGRAAAWRADERIEQRASTSQTSELRDCANLVVARP